MRDLPHKTSLLETARSAVREHDGISFPSNDIETLIEGRELLSATTINVVCRLLQQEVESEEGSLDWCVMSSWLGPISNGKTADGAKGIGFFEDLAKRAVPDGQFTTLQSRTRWLVPLCSARAPYHWILTWIDFARHKICFFDSIPEMGSTSWAEPLLLQIVDRIYRLMGRAPETWADSQWTREFHHPLPLQRQFDGWSCGVFVLMAVSAIARKKSIEDAVGNTYLTEMRLTAINLMFKTRVKRIVDSAADPTACKHHAEEVPGDEAPAPEQGVSSAGAMIVDPQLRKPEDNEGVDVQMDVDQEVVKRKPTSDEADDKRPVAKKLKLQVSAGDSKDSACADNGPKKYRSPAARRKLLEDDPHVVKLTVSESSVQCNKCTKTIKLNPNSNRPYEVKNWDDHKASCPQITGKTTVRVRGAFSFAKKLKQIVCVSC